MTFLPIVERELRVATRRRATYWYRSGAVVVATVVALYMLLTLGTFFGPARAGATLFSTLTNLAFFCCLFPGVFLTADCLSEEKREGTLGLLFLTDLKSYDVVLGKLMATSLNAFYGLLAIFPVLALPLLMGGVSFAEFWRVVLALVNTLIFSLAMGMFISSVSWKEQNAMVVTAGLLFLAGFMFPLIGGPFEWGSPRMALRLAGARIFLAHPAQFGWSLLVLQAFSWALLLLAGRKVPGSWQVEEPPAVPNAQGAGKVEKLQAENAGPGDNLQPETFNLQTDGRELLERNPIEWLAMRHRSDGWIWGSLGVVGFGWLVASLEIGGRSGGRFALYAVLSLHALLKFWISWEASRRFYEDRRDGTLESLLATPLSLADLMSGHITALFNRFVGPVVALLILDLVFAIWVAELTFSLGPVPPSLICGLLVIMGMLVVDAWALAWLGLWLGLNAKRSWAGAFGALARIVVLPASIFMVPTFFVGLGNAGGMAGMIAWAIIGGLTSIAFGAAARSKLHHHFREAAAEGALSRPRSLSVPPEAPELEQYFSLLKD